MAEILRNGILEMTKEMEDFIKIVVRSLKQMVSLLEQMLKGK